MKLLLCTSSHADVIKLAPAFHALKETALVPVVVHLGREFDSLRPLYDFFEMDPAHVVSPGQPSGGRLAAALVERFDALIESTRASAIIVHGASVPAFAAAQAAFLRHVPVARLEGNRPSEDAASEPRPRLHGLMTRLAYWHFAPTPQAVRFLREQGCPEQRIYYVRDAIVDATQWSLNHLLSYAARTPQTAALFGGDLIRRLQEGRTILIHTDVEENDTELALRLAQSACRLLAAHDELRVVWPLPSAPAIRRLVAGLVATQSMEVRSRLFVLDPPDYPQLIWLLKQAWLVITGTSGIQEEAATLNVPAMILQPNAAGVPIEAGGRVLLGPDADAICDWITRLAASREMHRHMAHAENPFGDGRTGKHIALILSRELHALRSAAPPTVASRAKRFAA